MLLSRSLLKLIADEIIKSDQTLVCNDIIELDPNLSYDLEVINSLQRYMDKKGCSNE